MQKDMLKKSIVILKVSQGHHLGHRNLSYCQLNKRLALSGYGGISN